MERIAAIVGAGLIGRAWAMVFARAGWRVRLYDSVAAQLDAARGLIATSLAEQQAAGLVADADAGARTDRDRRDASQARWRWRDWVQENLPENVDVKREMFAALDALRRRERGPRELDVGDSRVATSPTISRAARAAWSRIR